ncbi:MAG: signal peptide peptidase SppA [Rhodobacteraceae bacterium]|nr:signal peptide peptidase SppA [Paracoccaceae bacterium]
MRTLGKALLWSLATFGFFILALIGIGIYGITNADKLPKQVAEAPDEMILALDLDDNYSEGEPVRGLGAFGLSRSVAHDDALIAIRRAKDDERVKALVATISEQARGLAQTQDLRDAIADFRESGKPTLIFAETIGEGTPATGAYYMASAFEKIWVQPSGTVGLAGIGIEQPFFKGLLDRLGIKATVIQRKEYKSAMENLSNDAMSPANREALESLLGTFYEQFVTGIAAARNISEADVRALIDRGPLLSQEALDAHLIDRIGYRDEFDTEYETAAGTDKLVGINRYLSYPPVDDKPDPEKSIALIHAVGQIMRGEDGGPFAQNQVIASETMAKAVKDAAENDKIDAILIRIDSPGGSYVASDTIWREVVRAKEKKPVVVSMGNTAASGGYFIAMAADRIFAQPTTITGSIGVIFGKVSFGEASEKLDINWDRVSFGESAGMYSSVKDFNEKELARLNQMIDFAYNDFTAKAAQGRNKDVAELERAARGRVWTGVDALDAGLVDELGGFSRAVDYTKERIGLAPDDSVWLVPYPKPEDPFKTLLKAFENGDLPFGIISGLMNLSRIGGEAAPLLEQIDDAAQTGTRIYQAPITVR